MWRGTGGREARRKGGRDWEKRGREVGFPRWREAGEKGEIMQHCAIFCTEKREEAGANKYRVGTEITRYRRWEA